MAVEKNNNLYKNIICGIYFSVLIFAVSEMIAAYTPSKIFRYITIFSSLIIIGMEVGYIVLKLINSKKIVVSWFSCLFYCFLLFEIFISLKTNSFYFVDAYMDILPWPLTVLVFGDYVCRYEVPREFAKSTKFFFPIFILFSCFLVVKHLSGFGNVGGVVFPTYFCLTFLPFALVVIQNPKYKKTIMAATIFILMASTKRAGFLAVLIGAFCYLFTEAHIQGTLKSQKNKYTKLAILTLVILIGGFVLLKVTDITVINRTLSIKDDGGSGRNAIWTVVIDAFNASSEGQKIFGHGFQSVYYKLKPYGVDRLAHNSFIEYAYDYGYIGLGLLIIILLYVIRVTIKMLKKKDVYAPAMIYSLIISLVFGFVSYFFEQSVIIMPIAVLWGCGIGNYRKRKYFQNRR